MKKSVKSDNKLRPLGDRVIVTPLEALDITSASGIIIPETVDKEAPNQGLIIAVGDGKYDDGKKIPMTVKVGDKVIFSKYGHDEIKMSGKEYYIVSESNILAVIK